MVEVMIYGTLSGMAGFQISKLKGHNPIKGFWVGALFGPFGLLFLSTVAWTHQHPYSDKFLPTLDAAHKISDQGADR